MSATQVESASRVPSSLTQVRVTMKYTFLDYFRSRRFFILLAIVLLISAALTIVIGYYRPPGLLSSDLSFYSSWWGISAVLITAVLFLFAFNLIQLLVANFAQIEPWFILTYGSQIIGNVLMAQYPAHITTANGFGERTFTSYNATIPEGLAIIAAYFIVTAILGLVLFERKEFT